MMAALLGSLVISYALAVVYSLWLNPELRFWKTAYEQKIAWARKLGTTDHPKTVLIGGSSSAFQIDAGLLTKNGIPTVNMGMHAGMGSRAIAAFGLSAVNPGDMIVWAFEPDRMMIEPELEPLGYQLLVSTGVIFSGQYRSLALGNMEIGKVITSLRPGLQHTVTMLAKLFSSKPLYRYNTRFLHPGGALSTDEVREMPYSIASEIHPNAVSMKWIQSMAAALQHLGCSSKYLLPLSYWLPKDGASAIAYNKTFLSEIGHYLLVVPDPRLGVETNVNCFSDTPLHMKFEAMENRTDKLIPYFKPIR